MKKLFTLLITLLTLPAFSQSFFLTPQVMSSAGNYTQASTISLSQTIGEMVAINTLSSPSIFLTQGFQQGDLKNTIGIFENKNFNTFFNLYPNPASSFTNLEFEFTTPGKLDIAVYNMLGQQVSERFTEMYAEGTKHFTLQTNQISAGVYFVHTVFTDNNGKEHFIKKKLEVIR